MKSSRRWVAAFALALLAAGGVAFGGHAPRHGDPAGRTSAGGSWFSAGDSVTGAD
jgi:hypothetical protein